MASNRKISWARILIILLLGIPVALFIIHCIVTWIVWGGWKLIAIVAGWFLLLFIEIKLSGNHK